MLYNLYNMLSESNRNTVQYMLQELNQTALTQSTYSSKQTYCNPATSVMDVTLQRLDPALGMHYDTLRLQFVYTGPARWMCTLTYANTHLHFSNFSTLHEELKLFFGRVDPNLRVDPNSAVAAPPVAQATAMQPLRESKPTPASRRIVEL